MQERIQKIISAAGITSRRAAETLITEGRVRVNGKVVTELGAKADANEDHIKVDGKLINPKQPKTYIMLNKPSGYVTTMSDPEGRATVQDLLKGIKVRVYPVGRLDYNTEGMLLLTNDGDFAHLVTHPSHELPKVYLVKVKGVLSDEALTRLEQGVFLKDGKTFPARIRKLRKEEANSWLEVTIHEGKKRQVRRMMDHVGHTVIKLKRVKTGNLVIGELELGKYRHLTLDEVQGLKELAAGGVEQKPLVRERKVERPIVKPQVIPAKREGIRSEAGPYRPDSRGQRPEARSSRPDVRGRRTDARPQRPDVRGPRAGARPYSPDSRGQRPGARPSRPDVRGQRTDARPQRPDVRGPRTGAGPYRSDSRGQRPEFRPSRPDVRGQRTDARPQRPDVRGPRAGARPYSPDSRGQRPGPRPSRPEAGGQRKDTRSSRPDVRGTGAEVRPRRTGRPQLKSKSTQRPRRPQR